MLLALRNNLDGSNAEPMCSVEGCGRHADYEVFLYDYYVLLSGDQEFFEQDFTCPFLAHTGHSQTEPHRPNPRK